MVTYGTKLHHACARPSVLAAVCQHGHHAWRHVRAGIADDPLEAYCPYDDSVLYR